MPRILLATFLALACAGGAHAQGTISDDDASFVRGATAWDDGTPAWDGRSAADLKGASDNPTADHLFSAGWAFRVQGDTREFFFPTPDLQSYAGAISEHQWVTVEDMNLFGAVETSNVIDGDGPGGDAPSALVTMRLTLTNLSKSDPVTLDLFHAIDLDVGGSAANDAVELIAPLSSPTLRFTDSILPDIGYYLGEDADGFTAHSFGANDVFTALDDTDIDNFDDDVPAGNADFTAGMQWSNRTIDPGETVSIAVRFAINRPVLTPDLAISMQAAPDPVDQDTPLDYTVTVTNTLDLPSPNTSIVFDPFAPAVQFVQTSGCDNDPVGFPECVLGDLGIGAERQVSLRVVPGAGSPPFIEARATVGSPDVVDIAPENNIATTSTDVILLVSDLQVAKTNNVDDVAVDIDGWHWQIALRNSDTATIPATFDTGEVLLIDQLPNVGVVYGVPTLEFSGNENDPDISGTASCNIVAFDLTCTASSPMSFPPGSVATVTLPVMPQALGNFVNPRANGICTADPKNVVDESSETNNFCADNVLAIDFMLFSDSFED